MSRLARVALIVGFLTLLLAVVLDIVAIATTEWLTYSDGESGLWETCPDTGSCTALPLDDDLDIVRGTMLFGLFCGGCALLITTVELFYFIATYSITPWAPPTICATTFLAALFTLVGFVFFHVEFYKELNNVDRGFSFWLAMVAFLFFTFAGIAFIVAAVKDYKLLKKLKSRERERLYMEAAQYSNPPYITPLSRNERYEKNNWPHVRDPSPHSIPDPLRHNTDYRYPQRAPYKVYDHGISVIPKADYRGYRGDNGINPSAGGRSYRNASDFYGQSRTSHINGYGVRSASDRWARDPYGYPMNYNRD